MREAEKRRETLDDLIAEARLNPPSAAELDAQKRSFAYGTTHIENADITRDMIHDAAERFNTPD